MGGPLVDIRVVELGLWLAGPACGAILADWGAEVVKVEPLAGDPFRGLAWMYGGEMNPPFELDNRGKRSAAVDLAHPTGRVIMLELLARADVFVTNYRPGGLERLGLDWDAVHAHNPRLVYCSISGYGLAGPERDRASYDMGSFWSRAGMAQSLTLPGADLPYQRGGMGDHMTGVAAAGGIAAALFAHAGDVGARGAQPAADRLPLRRRRVGLAAVPGGRPALAQPGPGHRAARPAGRFSVLLDGGPAGPCGRGERHPRGDLRVAGPCALVDGVRP